MSHDPTRRDWLEIKRAPGTRIPLQAPPVALVARFNAILLAVAEAFGTTPALLKGPRRDRPVAQARFAAAALLLEQCPELSLPDIAWLLGRRNHTTILHARRRAAELLQPDRHSAPWRAKYQQARSRVTAGATGGTTAASPLE